MNQFIKVNYFILIIVIPVLGKDSYLSGHLGFASTYIFRGIKVCDGIAMQGSLSESYKNISAGIWVSTVNFGADSPLLETDLDLKVGLPTGSVTSTLGITLYTYDFSQFNDNADYEYEIFGTLEWNSFGLMVFYVPEQNSTASDPLKSTYWIILSAAASKFGLDMVADLSYGTYSSRWLSTPKNEAVSHLVLSVSKNLNQLLSLNWNYSIGLSSNLTKYLWIAAEISF